MRGTPLSSAVTVFEGEKTDVAVGAWVDHMPGFFREGFERRSGVLQFRHVGHAGRPKRASSTFPTTPMPNLFREWLTVRLRSDWTVGGKTYEAGSLMATKLAAYLKGGPGGATFDVLFEPYTARGFTRVSPKPAALWCST